MGFWDGRTRFLNRRVEIEAKDAAAYLVEHTAPAHIAKLLVKSINNERIECDLEKLNGGQYAKPYEAAVAIAKKLIEIDDQEYKALKIKDEEDD